jgi:hypothetical protein
MPEYIQGAELDNLPVTWTDPTTDLPYDFSSGFTFTVKIGQKGAAAEVTKTTGITGAASSPNIVIVWATTGDLNDLEPGTHVLQIEATRSSDTRSLFMQDSITIVEAVA